MSQEWMIDVLTDLKKFASLNGLVGLAEQLDDTIIFAAAAMNTNEPQKVAAHGYEKQDHGVSGTSASGKNV